MLTRLRFRNKAEQAPERAELIDHSTERAQNPPQEAEFDVKITERVLEAEGIVSLRLAIPDGRSLPEFEAGAHIDVRVAENLVRQYSLCNDPRERHQYRLGILLDEHSRGGSALIHRDFLVGKIIRIKPPKNNFPLVEGSKRSLLMAGGIGVTPLLAMAYRLDMLGQEFAMHYCARTAARAAFLSEIDSKFGDRAAFHFDDGIEQQRFKVEQVLSSPTDDTHLYVCGPSGFINHVTGAAKQLGWPEAAIHIEYFSAERNSSGEAFTVSAARTGITVEVLPTETIAEVLSRHGVAVSLSCEQGVCGTCLTAVLEGIPDHRDVYQTRDGKLSNKQIAICCSRAKSPKLVLDI